MASLTGIFVFGTILVAIFLILDVIMLVLTARHIKKQGICTIFFGTMTTFTFAQLGGFLYYMTGATEISQDPGKILMYLMYLTSITLILFIWVNRIKTTFQSTMWAYSVKLMKSVYCMVGMVVTFEICIFIPAVILFVVQKDGSNTDNPLYKVMYIFAALYLLSVISLSIFLSYLFIKKCVELIRFKSEMEASGTNSDNGDLAISLIKIQSKLTVLVVVNVSSTFFSIICNLIFVGGLDYEIGTHLAPIPTNIDIFINFYCIALIIKQNENIYTKACCCCIQCFNKIFYKKASFETPHQSEFNEPVDSGTNTPRTATSGAGNNATSYGTKHANLKNSTTIQTAASSNSQLNSTEQQLSVITDVDINESVEKSKSGTDPTENTKTDS